MVVFIHSIIACAISSLEFLNAGQNRIAREFMAKTQSGSVALNDTVMEKSNLIDLPVRYPPYTPFKEKLLKLLMR